MSIFSVFVAHFVIDLQFKILPDVLNLYLAFIIGSFSIVFNPWWFWALGGAIGFGFPYIITWAFYKYSGKVGLGGGDIKLYGALGLYLGPVGVMTNIFMSCFLGSVVTLLLIGLKLFKREDFIPFGPFIIVVGFFQIFLPEQFSWLLNVLGLQVY
jgi:leader peptidase (prepilin peptidase)/N-methyltransferase